MKVLESWDWFVPWLNRISLTTRLVFGLAIFSTLLNIWPSFKKYQNLTTAKTNWLYLPIWSAFLFWLFTAPDLRFLGPILALHIALSTWQFLQGHCANPDQPSAQPAFNKSSVGVFAVVCVIMFKLGAVDSTTHAGWRNIPSTTTTDKRTDYDFEIRMPVSNDACWDAALPCTPYFNGNLHQVPLKISIFGTPIIDRYYFSVIPK
jgi:hypothetical protein